MTDDLIARLRDATPPHYGKCLAAADEIERLRFALTRAAMRFDMVAPMIVENEPALAVTKWANETRDAAFPEPRHD